MCHKLKQNDRLRTPTLLNEREWRIKMAFYENFIGFDSYWERSCFARLLLISTDAWILFMSFLYHNQDSLPARNNDDLPLNYFQSVVEIQIDKPPLVEFSWKGKCTLSEVIMRLSFLITEKPHCRAKEVRNLLPPTIVSARLTITLNTVIWRTEALQFVRVNWIVTRKKSRPRGLATW